MNRFIQLNIENKEIQIPINEEIKKILDTKLENTYSFDENGKMQYKGNKETQMLLYETILDILKTSLSHEEDIPEEVRNKLSKENSFKGNSEQSSIVNKFFIKQCIIELAEDYYEYVQTYKVQEHKQETDKKNTFREQIEVKGTTIERTKSLEDLSEKIKSSGQNATENLELAKQVFLRATKDKLLSKYITQQMMDELFKDVKICKDNKEFFEEYFMEYLKGTQYKIVAFDNKEKTTIKYFLEEENEKEECIKVYDNQDEFLKKLGNKETKDFLTVAFFDGESNIVVPQDATLETIVHELVHKSSKIGHDKTGIYEAANKLIKDEKGPWKEFRNFSSRLNEKMLRSLDESFTEMVTRVLVPEIKTSSGYDYGSELITKYYETCKDDYQRDRFFKVYYQKNEYALDSLAMDIERATPMQENSWFNFCKAIVSGEIFYTKGIIGNMKNMMSSEEIKKIFENLSKKIQEKGQI